MLRSLWNFIGVEGNVKRLTLIGSVIAALAGAYVYFHPAKSEGGGAAIKASCGSVAIGGSANGATITGGASADCKSPP